VRGGGGRTEEHEQDGAGQVKGHGSQSGERIMTEGISPEIGPEIEHNYSSTGKLLVLAAVLLLGVLTYVYCLAVPFWAYRLSGLMMVALLCSELFWGNKWVLWLVGLVFVALAWQGLFHWAAAGRSWIPYLSFLQGVLGVFLLLSPQARQYMAYRRGNSRARMPWRLRWLPPILLVLVMTGVLFWDLYKVANGG
jgi:hypothetical protein